MIITRGVSSRSFRRIVLRGPPSKASPKPMSTWMVFRTVPSLAVTYRRTPWYSATSVMRSERIEPTSKERPSPVLPGHQYREDLGQRLWIVRDPVAQEVDILCRTACRFGR